MSGSQPPATRPRRQGWLGHQPPYVEELASPRPSRATPSLPVTAPGSECPVCCVRVGRPPPAALGVDTGARDGEGWAFSSWSCRKGQSQPGRWHTCLCSCGQGGFLQGQVRGEERASHPRPACRPARPQSVAEGPSLPPSHQCRSAQPPAGRPRKPLAQQGWERRPCGGGNKQNKTKTHPHGTGPHPSLLISPTGCRNGLLAAGLRNAMGR